MNILEKEMNTHAEKITMTIDELAKEFASKKHQGQKRKTGEDYITHPIAVAEILFKYKKSLHIDRLMAAAYLHDVLEDTDTTYYELISVFGYDVASIVKELTNNENMKKALGKATYLSYKLKEMSSWALTIKLCDRLHNVSSLNGTSESFKRNCIEETIIIINYICQNRKLSQTHKVIIRDINIAIRSLGLEKERMVLK